MAVQMIALKPHRYAGKALQPGDEFFVGGATQVRLLTALGRAALCPPLAPAPAAAPRRRRKAEEPEAAVQAELIEAPAAEEAAPAPVESTDESAPQ